MGELIYCQKQIPARQYRYGLRPSRDTGCGWIAVYNALCLLGQPEPPEQVIAEMERRLPLIHGNLGTTILAPAQYLRSRGFQVDWTSRYDRMDALVEKAQVCILFYRWKDRWRMGAHFVTLHKTDAGILGYNTYTNSTGPDPYGPSLPEFLKKRGYFGPVLMGAWKEKNR